tara:strand:+ start:96 stop:362 length:267 start_codon:yes stop_codon:yes gene_type:complete
LKHDFEGVRLNSVGAYLSKELYVYPETNPGYGTIIDDGVEVDIDNGIYILDLELEINIPYPMDGANEWYHSLSSEDKNIVDEAIKVGA